MLKYVSNNNTTTDKNNNNKTVFPCSRVRHFFYESKEPCNLYVHMYFCTEVLSVNHCFLRRLTWKSLSFYLWALGIPEALPTNQILGMSPRTFRFVEGGDKNNDHRADGISWLQCFFHVIYVNGYDFDTDIQNVVFSFPFFSKVKPMCQICNIFLLFYFAFVFHIYCMNFHYSYMIISVICSLHTSLFFCLFLICSCFYFFIVLLTSLLF